MPEFCQEDLKYFFPTITQSIYLLGYELQTENFPGVKRPGRGADPPSSAEVRNGANIPPFPHTFPWLDA
jgi:hypothetical protein